jgi:hypothetical protein
VLQGLVLVGIVLEVAERQAP